MHPQADMLRRQQLLATHRGTPPYFQPLGIGKTTLELGGLLVLCIDHPYPLPCTHPLSISRHMCVLQCQLYHSVLIQVPCRVARAQPLSRRRSADVPSCAEYLVRGRSRSACSQAAPCTSRAPRGRRDFTGPELYLQIILPQPSPSTGNRMTFSALTPMASSPTPPRAILWPAHCFHVWQGVAAVSSGGSSVRAVLGVPQGVRSRWAR